MSCDFLALAVAGVQQLMPYQAGKPIEELQRELGLDEIVKLASNENPLGPSSRAVEACQRALRDVCRYPDSNGFELKKALADKYAISPERITLGNGSNDILELIARAYLGQGRSAVYSQYAFIVYPLVVKACGARGIVAAAQNWGHDLDAMAAAIADDTAVVFIANPNNPTGTAVDEAQLRAFLHRVPEHVIVVLDEAYIEYAGDDFPDGLQLQTDFPNLVVSRTFSKAYGLAGLRVGYAIASRQICDVLNRVRAAFNVNSLAQAAAVAALGDSDYLQRSRDINRRGMQQLVAGMEALGIDTIPSAGNFVAAQMPGDTIAIYQGLLREGIIVRPVGVYNMPQHLRISVGLEVENSKFLSVLPRVLERLAGAGEI